MKTLDRSRKNVEKNLANFSSVIYKLIITEKLQFSKFYGILAQCYIHSCQNLN